MPLPPNYGLEYSLIALCMLISIMVALYSYQKKMDRYHLELQLAFKLFEELMEEVAGNINLDLNKKMEMITYLKKVESQVGPEVVADHFHISESFYEHQFKEGLEKV